MAYFLPLRAPGGAANVDRGGLRLQEGRAGGGAANRPARKAPRAMGLVARRCGGPGAVGGGGADVKGARQQ